MCHVLHVQATTSTQSILHIHFALDPIDTNADVFVGRESCKDARWIVPDGLVPSVFKDDGHEIAEMCSVNEVDDIIAGFDAADTHFFCKDRQHHR